MDSVSIVGFERAYLDGLQEVAARRREGEKIFVLFLGSTIGNFDRPAGDQFLREVRAILREGDALLLATDLAKPVAEIETRLRRSGGRDGRVQQESARAHQPRARRAISTCRNSSTSFATTNPNGASKCILRSTAWQRVTIRAAGFRFYLREGETIWTESSHKYDPKEVIQMGERTGYRCARAVVRF